MLSGPLLLNRISDEEQRDIRRDSYMRMVQLIPSKRQDEPDMGPRRRSRFIR